ncbi:hypothetical protein PR202_ga15925 [Eleusine coracana subsp. coracana]|uniref:Uncharacterized protein n=1 Tax=Eleusine coracana subsp. coracana TaxID=191504 RepID=A0AAV5CLC0_ELECO|nr:hypothetical protein PR202_ga15925 [Eleusine coracana subsp. coracana]
MSLLSWNCQRSGRSLSSPTSNHLGRLIVSTRAQLIFVSETRSVNTTRTQLINRFSMHEAHVIPVAGQSRGLWLMWKDDVSLTVVQDSHYLILA